MIHFFYFVVDWNHNCIAMATISILSNFKDMGRLMFTRFQHLLLRSIYSKSNLEDTKRSTLAHFRYFFNIIDRHFMVSSSDSRGQRSLDFNIFRTWQIFHAIFFRFMVVDTPRGWRILYPPIDDAKYLKKVKIPIKSHQFKGGRGSMSQTQNLSILGGGALTTCAKSARQN